MSSGKRIKLRPKRLANRLAYAYVGLFSAVMLLVGGIVLAAAYAQLSQSHAENLQATALFISDHLADEFNEGEDLSDREVLQKVNTNWDLNLILFDAAGNTVNSLRNYYMDEARFKDADAHIRTKLADGQLLMYVKLPIDLDGAAAASLLLVLDLQTELNFLTLLAILLLLASVVGVLSVALFSRLATRRVLAPVEGMIAAAAAIDSSNLACRLNVPEDEAELRTLALAVNSMLDRVEQAFRLQEQFAADASHELRTPLSVMQGYVDLLLRWGGSDPAVREEAIAALDQQTRYMNRLVSNLLLLARLESGEANLRREEFDALPLLQELATEQGMLFAEAGHSYAAQGDSPCPLSADRSMIAQLLRIMLDNAAKYTPSGGEITLSCNRTAKGVTLCVADNGIGMAPEDLARAFDRFYRADKARSRATGGMGLGLSIARSIAAAHGGSISARAWENGGTVVDVRLP